MDAAPATAATAATPAARAGANPLAAVGRAVLGACAGVGELLLFAVSALALGLRGPYYPRQILRQMVDIGFYSLPVVGLTAIFTGMVLALQSHTGFSRFEAGSAIPTIVVLSMTRELGPVLAGLMVAGRVGAAMAAELGTMRVTEQIDALTTLSTDPLRYLVFPRLLAGTLMLPLLVLVADAIGVMGGFLVSVWKLGFGPISYVNQTLQFLELGDVVSGLVKAAVFGFIVALMGCYQGYRSRGGAQGVGAATTKAVVTASILILTANYVVTELFFSR
jgi:phospholipid/cholesterol/gamma-HCH transport system permease protein